MFLRSKRDTTSAHARAPPDRPNNLRALLNPQPSPYSDTGADAAIARQAQLETWSKSTSVEASMCSLLPSSLHRPVPPLTLPFFCSHSNYDAITRLVLFLTHTYVQVLCATFTSKIYAGDIVEEVSL